MRPTFAARPLVVLLLLTCATLAHADDDPSRAAPEPEAAAEMAGGSLSLAGGVALIPVGSSRHMTLAPIGVEIGHRSARGLEVGGLVELAPSIGGDCEPATIYPTTMSCKGWRARVGFRGRAHFLPSSTIDPWVGTGLALDVFYAPGYSDSTDAAALWGFSLPHLEIGADVRVGSRVVIAPFASVDLGMWTGTLANRRPPSWASEGPFWTVAGGARIAYGGL